MPEKLAIDGGPKAVKTPVPPRALFDEREKKAVVRLFDDAIKTGNVFSYNGPEEEAYCREFAAYLGGGYADAVNSGTSAVYVALRAVGVKAFSEVICGPISDPGGIMPVALSGCIPVLADGAPGSFNIDPDSVEKLVNSRTGAIIVAHIAGLPADMGPIMEIARAKGIPVVEDCAQSHGATYRGKYVGTVGDAGAFSTMSGKHHATGSQGGVVFTKDEETYWRARRYSDRGKPFGLERSNGNVVCSHNLNLNDLAACIGRVQLKKLPKIIKGRQRAAGYLIDACKKHLKAVRIPDGPPRSESVYWFLFVQLDLDRLRVGKDEFCAAVAAEGVPAGASYRHVFTEQDWHLNRDMLTGSDFPWDSPHYKGDPDRTYPIPNFDATDRCTFRISLHERMTRTNMREIFNAFKKVEEAYLK